jgi:hypothetical protein
MWQPKEKFEGRLQEFVLRIPKNLAQAVAYHQPLPIQAHLGNSHAHLFTAARSGSKPSFSLRGVAIVVSAPSGTRAITS